MSGVIATMLLVTAGCGASEVDSDAASDAPLPTTPTTSTTLATTTTTASSTTTSTIAQAETLPVVVPDGEEVISAALQLAFDSGPLEVRYMSRTGQIDSAGRLTGGEQVHVVNQWDGEVMSGRANFNGIDGTTSRGNGNRDLIATLLLAGSTYSFDGEWVVLERQLLSTIGEDVPAEGSDWVKVRLADLDEPQQFALGLLAPYASAMPIETSEAPPIESEVELVLVERRGTWRVYESTVSWAEGTAEGFFVVDGEGRLRESRVATSDIGGSLFLTTYRPLEASAVRSPSVESAEDVTDAFASYATERYSRDPESLGG